MKKIDISKTVKNVKNGFVKYSPEILTGIGIAGFVTTTIVAVKATPKALELIEKEKEEKSVHNLTPKETIKVTWKCYVPAVVTGSLSVACLISSKHIDSKRKAALATAYTIAETSLKEYRSKVVETLGEKKAQKVDEEIAKDHVKKNPPKSNEIIFADGDDVLCFDQISGRYFKSDMNKLKAAINDLNFQLINEMYVSLNDFYYEIGLPCTSLGNELGWNINDGKIEPSYTSQLTNDGKPVLVISYYVAPRYDFSKLM